MRIKEASAKLEISPDWLRELERQGRIPPAKRDLNGHRRYSEDEIKQLQEVLYGKSDSPKGTPN